MDKKVAVLMGSQSDQKVMQACVDILMHFDIPHEVHVMSAHRNSDAVLKFSDEAEANGFAVIIAGAGMAAHLPGVIASRTTLPVIGVPLAGSALNGVDALYAIVQMPGGIPVASMAIGKAGAKNAAIYAAEILALNDSAVKDKLSLFRQAGCKI